jgi:HAD superfamily hydrolase (TIGR01509 family)
VLDFDGTVVDTESPVYRSWWELWDEHGHDLSRRDWQAIIGTYAGFDPLAELERRLGRPVDGERVRRRLLRRDELQAAHELRPGVRSWLDEADRLGVEVGIASSSSADWVEGHLLRLGIRDRFTALACRADDVPPKPDPTSFRLACRLLGADPARSVAVEDSPHGVLAARAAGLYVVAVPHELTADLDLSAADLVLDHLDELTLADALARAAAR